MPVGLGRQACSWRWFQLSPRLHLLGVEAASVLGACGVGTAGKLTGCMSGSLPRSIESLYKELVEEGLLIRTHKVSLSDYIGNVHKAAHLGSVAPPGL